MDTVDKHIGCGFLVVIILIFIVGYLSVLIGNEAESNYNEAKAKYEQKIGDYYKINETDSVKIVNYSILFDTFTLSNGSEVSSALILKEK